MTHYFLGNDLSEQKKYDGAIEEFTMAVQEKPDFASAYHERGLAYYKLREYEYAVTDFTTALSYKRDFPTAFCNRAAAQAELGLIRNAIDDCTAAIRLSPEDATSYNIRGRAYLKLGDTDRGLDDLEKGGQLEAARLCLVCMEAPRGARLHPCMHAGLCVACAKLFHARQYACPLCSRAIHNLDFGVFDKTYAFDADFKLSW
eukprot:CAMPEP_0198233198 /NCGR_PEP_ID=MMETSP1445-20131203/116117_1 /TAXON_ID=36898 /ORGANISM="Pyramimonas sp., Strain CCMP2087" /LENGTH=201 /DNA_ID=CAMNT_0043913887 /DNA_START=591 /DNA_END=1193 /DNA_ORIENTATION=-